MAPPSAVRPVRVPPTKDCRCTFGLPLSLVIPRLEVTCTEIFAQKKQFPSAAVCPTVFGRPQVTESSLAVHWALAGFLVTGLSP